MFPVRPLGSQRSLIASFYTLQMLPDTSWPVLCFSESFPASSQAILLHTSRHRNIERLTVLVAELGRIEERFSRWPDGIRHLCCLSPWPDLHCRATSKWERSSWGNLREECCRKICQHISKSSLADIKRRSASKERDKSRDLRRRLIFPTGLPSGHQWVTQVRSCYISPSGFVSLWRVPREAEPWESSQLTLYPHGKELSHPNVNIGKRLRNARISKLFLNLLSARTEWGVSFFPSSKHTKSFLFHTKSLSCGPESPEHPFHVWALCFSCLTLWHLPICACFLHFFPSTPPQYPQANTNQCSISTQLPILNLTLIMES